MEKEDMMLVLLVVIIAIASLQAVQAFGMYSEANQIRAMMGPQLSGLGSGIGSGLMDQQSAPQGLGGAQGIGGC